MNKNVVMIMGGAFVVALLVAMMVNSKLSGGHSKSSSAEILVASKKLLIGEKIKKEDVRWQAWPDDAMFKGVIKKSEQEDENKLAVYDTPLRRDVESGEPVTTQATLSAKGGGNFLAASIGPGMRAVSIGVRPETSVAGFLSPGDYVDVILSYSPKFNNELQPYSGDVVQEYASETILSNVKILAVDQEAKDSDREAKTVKTVTIEVTKSGAETLALAERMGEISLNLRRMGEKDNDSDKRGALTTDMLKSRVLKTVVGVMEKQKTSSDTVRVYSGTNIQNLPVRASGGQ